MARKSQIRWWQRKGGGYFTTIAGRQCELALGPKDDPHGPTYLKALSEYRKQIELQQNIGTDDYLISSLLNQYRIHLHDTRKNSVPACFDSMVKGFSVLYGHMKVVDLRAYHVETFLKEKQEWNNSTKALIGRLILGAVAWARKKGFIKTDPIARCVDLPTPVLRGREARLSHALRDLLISEAHKSKFKSREFGNLLWALKLTGARPGELRNAMPYNYDGKGRIVFRWNTTIGYVHKTAKTSQRDREIHLNPELRQLVEEQIRNHPKRPIFSTPHGKKWTLQNLCNKWQWLLDREAVKQHCQENGIDPQSLKVYFFRHSFISDFCDKTSDLYTCASICGTSVAMIEKRYGHPDIDKVHEKYLAAMSE